MPNEVRIEKIDPAALELWAAGASEVDPEDEELSAAWQGVLIALASGNPYRDRLLGALQQMSPDEVHQFLARNRLFGEDPHYRRRFAELGLCRPTKDLVVPVLSFLLPAIFIAVACLVWVMGVWPAEQLKAIVDPNEHRARVLGSASYVLIAMLCGGIGSIVAMFQWSWPTQLGRCLGQIARSSLTKKRTQKQPADLSGPGGKPRRSRAKP